MWSVGVITYILLCGYHPFIGANLETDKTILMKKIRNAEYDFDHPNWDEVSSVARQMIRKMINKDVSQRYTAKQCLKDPWITGVKSSKPLNTGMLRATSSMMKAGLEDAFQPK